MEVCTPWWQRRIKKVPEDAIIAYWNGEPVGFRRYKLFPEEKRVAAVEIFVTKTKRRSALRSWSRKILKHTVARSYVAHLAMDYYLGPEPKIGQRLLEVSMMYFNLLGYESVYVTDIVNDPEAMGLQKQFLKAHRFDGLEWERIKLTPVPDSLLDRYRWHISSLDSFRPQVTMHVMDPLMRFADESVRGF